MGYGFPLLSASQVEVLGMTAASGTAVAGSATAGNYGSLTTIGTTGFSYDGFLLQNVPGAGRNWKITLTASTAGGADETIVQDVVASNINSTAMQQSMSFPVRVPAGAVIKAKVADNIGSSTIYLSILGYRGNKALNRGYSRVISLTDFGASGTNQLYPNTLLTMNGTTLTGWSEIVASTSASVGVISPAITTGASSMSAVRIMLELGYGAAGSEITTGIKVGSFVSTNVMAAAGENVPYFIPVGTRLAVRGQASGSESHTVGMVVWGFQL